MLVYDEKSIKKHEFTLKFVITLMYFLRLTDNYKNFKKLQIAYNSVTRYNGMESIGCEELIVLFNIHK